MKKLIIIAVVAIVVWLLFFRKKQSVNPATEVQPQIPTGGTLETWLSPSIPASELPTTQSMRVNNGGEDFDYLKLGDFEACVSRCESKGGNTDLCPFHCGHVEAANYTRHNDIWSTISKSNQLNLIAMPGAGTSNIFL